MEPITEKVVKKAKQIDKIKEPGKFKVIFCNDDVTPMEFVVSVLITVFRHTQDRAMQITMEVHHSGSGVAGIYPFEIAEQKEQDASNLARANNFPLVIKIEPE